MESQKCFEDAKIQSWGIVNSAPGEFLTYKNSRESKDIINLKKQLLEVGEKIGMALNLQISLQV